MSRLLLSSLSEDAAVDNAEGFSPVPALFREVGGDF
jgi:hypothetical protein